ncbi:MAG: PfkB family carbohydrate kinase [Jatrophihabitantaceae bacterium]
MSRPGWRSCVRTRWNTAVIGHSAMTGWSEAELLAQVSVQVTTHGKNGADISGRDPDRVHVPVAKERAKVDPTGVGDGSRAGLLAGRTWGLSWERSAQVAACSRLWCWRPSAPRSTWSSRTSSPTGSPSPTVTTRPPKSFHYSLADAYLSYPQLA